MGITLPNGHKCPFGRSGCVTAVAIDQGQRLYSGVRMFTWFDLSSINIICLVGAKAKGKGVENISKSKSLALTCKIRA